MESFHQTIWKF